MVTPGPVLPLDKLITGETPTFASPEEVEAFEQTPYDERIAAKSTYEAIQIGASLTPARQRSSSYPTPMPMKTPSRSATAILSLT